jgi:hypothetical protein
VARRGFGASAPTLSNSTRADDSQIRPELLADLGRALITVSQQTSEPRGERQPSKELVRKSPEERLRLQLSAERSLRIEAARRARRLPYLATAATAVGGYAAWGAAELATAMAGQPGEAAAIAGAAGTCAICLAAVRIGYRHRIESRWQGRWWTAGVGAASWITTAAAFGPASWPMTAALAAGAAAVSAGWLRAHDIPAPGTELPAMPMVQGEGLDEDPTAALLAARWAETVAQKLVPGSLLTDRQILPNGIRWTVETVPGTTQFSELLNIKGKIASGLRQPSARVILEPGEDESTALLTVITRDVLAAGVPYRGPQYDNGRILVGPYADGEGWAEYFAYDAVGVRCGLVTGSPGSGKSAFLEIVGLSLRASGEWYLMFGDGDPSGGSSPLLNQIAHWPEAGPRAVLKQLEAIEAAIELRSMLKATLTLGPDGKTPVPITDPATQVPIREIIPCPQYPGIMWIIDELHRLTKDQFLKDHQFADRLERVCRLARKYGIGVIAGTQSLLGGDFGGNTPLRAYLSARNMFAFRNTNKSESATVQGLEVAPWTLPEGGGYALSGGDGRLSMLRAAWARDLSQFAVGLPDGGLDADTDLSLDPFRPEEALDPVAQYAVLSARLAAWRTAQSAPGADRPGTTSDRTDGQADRTGSGPDRSGGQADRSGTGPFSTAGLTGLVIPRPLTAANVIPFRRTEPGPVQPAWTDDGPDLDVLRPPHRLVYEALASGLRRTGDIVERTQLKAPAVSKALKVLEEEYQLVRKLAHGEWEPADPTDQERGA